MKKIIWPCVVSVVYAVALLLAFVGCGNAQVSSQAQSDDSLQKVQDAGTLVLGFDGHFPPMGFTDASGEAVGFDIDVAQEVCNRMGVTLTTQAIDWDAKETLLNNGQIDCIWNGMSVTNERSNTMTLSEPYMKNELVFVVPGDSEIKAMGDLKGKTVGVQRGTTAQQVLQSADLSLDITIVAADGAVALLDELNHKKYDAAFLDSVAAYYNILANDERLYVVPGNLKEEKYAVGFRKGDDSLRNRVQELLNEMRQDGTLAQISVKWFGSDITTLK